MSYSELSETNVERRSLSYHTACINLTFMLVHDGLGNRQTETVSTMFACSGRIRTIEAIEDSVQMLRCDTFPCIGDGKHHLVIMLLQRNIDRAFGFGIFHSVIQQNQNNLLDLFTTCLICSLLPWTMSSGSML